MDGDRGSGRWGVGASGALAPDSDLTIWPATWGETNRSSIGGEFENNTEWNMHRSAQINCSRLIALLFLADERIDVVGWRRP